MIVPHELTANKTSIRIRQSRQHTIENSTLESVVLDNGNQSESSVYRLTGNITSFIMIHMLRTVALAQQSVNWNEQQILKHIWKPHESIMMKKWMPHWITLYYKRQNVRYVTCVKITPRG